MPVTDADGAPARDPIGGAVSGVGDVIAAVGEAGLTSTQDPAGGVEGFEIDPALLEGILGSNGGDEEAKTVNSQMSRLTTVYEQIWGLKAPKHYIWNAVKEGMTDYEFAQSELSRAGAQRTRYWRDQAATWAAELGALMGTR